MNKNMKLLPLYIVMTAYHSGQYIEKTLDTIYNEIVQLDNTKCRIYLGIDNCLETLKKVSKIRGKFKQYIRVFYANKNVGTYILKNSLLNTIEENSLIFIFDSDDMIYKNFIRKYYYKFFEYKNKYNENIILRTRNLGIPDNILQNSINKSEDYSLSKQLYLINLKQNNYYDAISSLLAIQNHIPSQKIIYMIKQLLRIYFMNTQQNDKLSDFQYTIRKSVSQIFIELNTLKKLGFYNKYRVGQDYDLYLRAKQIGIKIIDDVSLPIFIRRISKNSLTGSVTTGHNSKYRELIKKINLFLIEKNYLKAKGKIVKLDEIKD